MKKLLFFIWVVVFAGSLRADNIVFNPGFDMTPWDTGWTIEFTQGGAPVPCTTYRSPPRSCELNAEHLYAMGQDGEAIIYQEVSNVATGCTCRVYFRYHLKAVVKPPRTYMVAGIKVRVKVNNVWKTIGEREAEATTLNDSVEIFEYNWTPLESVFGSADTIGGIKFWAYAGGGLAPYPMAKASFWVDDVYISGQTAVEESEKLKVKSVKLDACPNPFTQKTEIRVQNPEARNKKSDICSLTSDFCLTIHDLSGRVVCALPITNNQSPVIKVSWDGRDELGRRLPGGIYFAKLVTREEEQVLKLILVK